MKKGEYTEPILANNLISSIKRLGSNAGESTLKDIIKNFLYTDMAIKEAKTKPGYTAPEKPIITSIQDRSKTINEAKLAFLNSNVHQSNVTPKSKFDQGTKDPSIHYARIAITTEEDARSTGGGKPFKEINEANLPLNVIQKRFEPQPRKVSFKIKNAANYRRQPVTTKTTVTINTNKVSDLTKKFNNLVIESHHRSIKPSKIVKTIEDIQNNSKSSSSTCSSLPTTTNSPIKIIVKQRRGSKKRNRKRCSSVESLNKLDPSDSFTKTQILRSKSDGNRIPKSPKKKLKFPEPIVRSNLGTDSIDGSPSKSKENIEPKVVQSVAVKNVIKKFECELAAQSNTNTLTKKKQDLTKKPDVPKDKPKIPERKSSLVLTKNIVVKDGVPKIRVLKPPTNSSPKKKLVENVPPKDDTTTDSNRTESKESQYDVKKYKTHYLHNVNLPLKAVEIIQEDLDENLNSTNEDENQISAMIKERNEKIYQSIDTRMTPNQSFLWRGKSQPLSEADKSLLDSTYGTMNSTSTETLVLSTDQEGDSPSLNESAEETQVHVSQVTVNGMIVSEDFESNLVEAVNNEIMRAFSTKTLEVPEIEDDYEPVQLTSEVQFSTLDRSLKIKDCPLPEIPKGEPVSKSANIYQTLLEMRSHPEGDESSLHSYELCSPGLEERTRGDGDSDDGYEICKTPSKNYTSQSTVPKDKTKHYALSKSVSGASTVSYEKIGFDRIYEKIPVPKPKNSPQKISHKHSFMSDISYNYEENIYDTIKNIDGGSNCYESIPNSPSVVKLRENTRRLELSSKRLSFDAMSNVSHSTMSSEQKTNSIYGQRSILNFNGQEINFQVPSSETSISDRSDEWIDVSDEEKTDQQKIVIVRERSRGRKSPVSWSHRVTQVRHQRQRSPRLKTEYNEGDNSDSGHLYESLEPPLPVQSPTDYDDDIDSFDSDSDTEADKNEYKSSHSTPQLERLPEPPSGGGGTHTLTKIANAAQKKMRQLKRNLTKRYSVAIDGTAFQKFQTGQTKPKPKSSIYENYEKPEIIHQHIYSNIELEKAEGSMARLDGAFKDELKNLVGEKRIYADIPPPLPEKPPPEKPVTPKSDGKKDPGTLSRKTYFSFKSRFRRASSVAVDLNDVPSALKITNSTFYLTDSMDGDSGFSNCSDSAQNGGSSEALPASPANQSRREGMRPRPSWSESSPCLNAQLERPSLPPPPPPTLAATELSAVNEELKRLLPSLSRKEKGVRTRSSWYADCGSLEGTPPPASRPSSTSWYAEVGLYQAGNISSSSGASSGSHPASPLPHSLFTHEPLYQFYNAAKLESVCRETIDSDSDAYETSPPKTEEVDSTNPGAEAAARPSAMALVAPRGPARTLWCEVPEVVSSTVLSSLAPAQKRLQEAKFELLTSEASYLNSLNVLETHFISHPTFRQAHILPRAERDTLFATITPVRKCSQQLMNELEKCWQENILLQGICEIVRAHAEKHFHVYVKYCENQVLMVKALQRLRDRPAFATALRRLESHPDCQSLSLHSFLMLPMQRITRLPLLMDAVLKNLNDADEEYQSCMDALATLNTFVSQCNEGARNTERVEEMFRLAQLIEFPASMTDPPTLAPSCARRDKRSSTSINTSRPIRWLVRSGEMTQLVWKTDELKLTFGKKFHKIPLHLFLFNDLLVITKKKGESSFIAVEYCARSLLEVCSGDSTAHGKHSLLLTLLENHQGRTVEMLMSCPSETDLSRWTEALSPPTASKVEGEAVYAGWDCPQVTALYEYAPAQPDELPLTEGDIVNVTRKTCEGWYYGERIRDGETGWFPGAYTVEIASPHVRARNLRQRYRLLALSGTYLGQRKKANT